MKTSDFLKRHDACIDGAEWALSVSNDMADVWDALIAQGNHEWLMWTAARPGVFPDSTLRKLACRFVRETPLADGRKVWDLMEDDRSRKAVEVAERFAAGNATDADLESAYAAARAAYAAARAEAEAACFAAHAAYAAYAADAAAGAAVHAATHATLATAWSARAAAGALAAYDSAYASAYDAHAAAEAAKSAQITMIAQLRNPFKEGEANENHCFFVGTSCPY